ncbi:MAG TPA: Gfo/Idh/MocA family oxidoreductase [Acidimicrobiales bacterium]|nr:Gfo/Idh/MocA family oxidoreductase [Acidimicrobiales bacterium]
MERVRLGVVGIGNIAPLNVAGYLEHPHCDVVALCDPREDKARAMAAQWNVAKVYTSLDALLADDEIDAVEILTPTHMHKDHVLAAIAAGKHVSVQKPIANTVSDARAMRDAADAGGVVLRVSECFLHYPPLVKAKELIASGAIGIPTMLRMKTVVGTTDTAFQANLEPEGYEWRFNDKSPGGHLFDDVIHKYGVGIWLFDQAITSVQAIVRRAPVFFEAPTAAIWEYQRPSLLGMMEVTYSPDMFIRSRYYGADEFFEIQGTEGFIWVTRATGEMLDLAPVVHYAKDGTQTNYDALDADWLTGFRGASRHFVDALVAGTRPVDMTPDAAIAALQLCFAVYQASNKRSPVDPRSIDGSVGPPWWPLDPTESIDLFNTYGRELG